jgi:hypothetical protein
MLEKQIEARLKKRVKELGGLSFKWISSVSGVSDQIVFLNGKVFFVELKTEKGVVSERQKIVFKQLEEQGFPVSVLRSYEDIEEWVNEATKP